MTKSGRLWAVIPAAGIGTRMQSSLPKQYLTLNGRTVLDQTIKRLLDTRLFHKVVVALHADDQWWPQSDYVESPLIETVVGGVHRSDSVLCALDALNQYAEDSDWVLVHDAARPCVRHLDILRLIEAVSHHPVGGILARPIADTIKFVERTSIRTTQDREHLWRALTPQMFRLNELRLALQQANHQITDESSAIEALGKQPIVVTGHADNIKITEPEDLALAEIFLKQQEH